MNDSPTFALIRYRVAPRPGMGWRLWGVTSEGEMGPCDFDTLSDVFQWSSERGEDCQVFSFAEGSGQFSPQCSGASALIVGLACKWSAELFDIVDLLLEPDVVPVCLAGKAECFQNLCGKEESLGLLGLRDLLMAHVIAGNPTRLVEVDAKVPVPVSNDFIRFQNRWIRELLESDKGFKWLRRMRARQTEWEVARQSGLARELDLARSSIARIGGESPERRLLRTFEPNVPVRKSCNHREVLEEAVGTADVVTADVFDTLLCRRIPEPRHVFWVLGNRLASKTGISAEAFVDLRTDCERCLYEKVVSSGEREDVSLEMIYQAIARELGFDLAQVESWKETEIRLESELIYAHPDAQMLLEVAGEKLQLCLSEMYLPSGALELWLSAQLTRSIPVITSGESGKSKRTGSLFSFVAERLDCLPEAVLHVGDHPENDVLQAKKSGMRALQWNGNVNALVDEIGDARMDDAVSSAMLGIAREGAGSQISHAHRIGFEIAGPLTWAYLNWLSQMPEVSGGAPVWMLARDGYWLEQMSRRLPDTYFGAGGIKYVYASRRMLGMAAIDQLIAEDWDFLLKPAPEMSVRDFFERVDMDPSSLVDYMENLVPDWTLDTRITHRNGFIEPEYKDHLYHLFVSQIEGFHRSRAAVRKPVIDYLRSLNPEGEQVVAVDLGWHGSSIAALNRIARSLEWRSPVGCYFATWKEAEKHDENCDVRSFLIRLGEAPEYVAVLQESIALIEALFSAPHPTVTGIAENSEGEWNPVFERDNRNAEVLDSLDGVWAGALDFAEKMVRIFPNPVDLSGHSYIVAALRRLLRYPSPEDLSLFSSFEHTEGWGIERSVSILERFSDNAETGLLVEGYRRTPWRRGWLSMLSADQRAQLRRHYDSCEAGF